MLFRLPINISFCILGLAAIGCGGTNVVNSTQNQPQAQSSGNQPAKPLTPEQIDRMLEQAQKLSDGGDLDQAMALIQEYHQRQTGNWMSHLVLGRMLHYVGRTAEAFDTWEAGCNQSENDIELLMEIAGARKEMAQHGPRYSSQRGSFTYRKAKPDDPTEEQYAKEQLSMAMAALNRALALAPDNMHVIDAMTGIQLRQRNYEPALKLLEKMLSQEPKHPHILLKTAIALYGTGRKADALKRANEAIAIEHRLVIAYGLIEKIHNATGHRAKALAAAKKKHFYLTLAPFVDLQFTPERFDFLARFFGLSHEADKASSADAINHKQELERLIAANTEEARGFLATICLRHAHHGEVENLACNALERKQDTQYLLGILENAHSTCTTKKVAHALARLKHRAAVEPLINILPADFRPFMHSDIAGALATLGDPRAIEPLINILAPADVAVEEEPGDVLHKAAGRQMARERAALALGVFDTDASNSALNACLNNQQIVGVCHLALYRLNGDADHLKALDVAIQSKTIASVPYVIKVVAKLEAPEAKSLAAKYKGKEFEYIATGNGGGIADLLD